MLLNLNFKQFIIMINIIFIINNAYTIVNGIIHQGKSQVYDDYAYITGNVLLQSKIKFNNVILRLWEFLWSFIMCVLKKQFSFLIIPFFLNTILCSGDDIGSLCQSIVVLILLICLFSYFVLSLEVENNIVYGSKLKITILNSNRILFFK